MDETTRNALKLINMIREEWGIEPLAEMPKGVPGSACGCPVARALRPCGNPFVNGNIDFKTREDAKKAEYAMGGRRITALSPLINVLNPWSVVPPNDLLVFIDNFDNERYPELLEA